MRRSSNAEDLVDPLRHASIDSGPRILHPNRPYLSSSYDHWTPGSYDGHATGADAEGQRQRSTSFSARFRQVGGVNSIDNFTRSWQRAAGFAEVIPRRPSFVAVESDDECAIATGENAIWRVGSHGQRSDTTRPSIDVESDVIGEEEPLIGPGPSRVAVPSTGTLGTSFERLYGSSYGTISSRMSEGTRRRAIEFHKEHQLRSDKAVDDEREPLLVREVQHEDGTRENIIVGQSTVPQTIFNSVNVLIGVGLLSLPLAMKQAGWLIGLSFLLFSALTTSYTAKILARCLDVDHSLVTYADLAFISFGNHARLVVSLLFCLELVGAGVALVVLFADSLHALLPGWTTLQWKIVCGIILVPLNFLPLRLLSVTSIFGILSCTAIIILICVDGLIKRTAPGSLIQPSRTSLFPDNWATVPLSFGLIMAPWGGHGVFPNIYRDMRHPHKYGKSLWITYLFTYSLDCTMAIIGWIMFGEGVRDEITANILMTDDYPKALSLSIIVFISIISITKMPLNCRPLMSTVEVLCGLTTRHEVTGNRTPGGDLVRLVSRVCVRVFVVTFIVAIAIVFPEFDRIMALMGSCLCFTICIILPLAFYLKIFGKDISPRERAVDWLLLIVSSVMAITGTAWAFLPKEMIAGDTSLPGSHRW